MRDLIERAHDVATDLVNDHYARMTNSVSEFPGLTAPTKRELVKAFLRAQVGEMKRHRDAVAEALRALEVKEPGHGL